MVLALFEVALAGSVLAVRVLAGSVLRASMVVAALVVAVAGRLREETVISSLLPFPLRSCGFAASWGSGNPYTSRRKGPSRRLRSETPDVVTVYSDDCECQWWDYWLPHRRHYI